MKLFGTDGIRGRALKPPLDEETVRRLGSALAIILAGDRPPRILLGGDTRASTQTLAEWLAGSFRSAGGEVTWGGVLPTPAVSHLLRMGGYDAGFVISASHNPAHDNGIKVLGPTGEKLADDSEARLEEQIAASSPVAGDGLPAPDRTLVDRYIELLVATHEEPAPLKGMHIVVDAAHGAASGIAGDLLQRLGAKTTAIASEPDGYNINAGCGATDPEQLVATVRALGADGGIALDGDADRAIMVDDKGDTLDGDDILLAWARHLSRSHRLPYGRVVATVMSNYGLERALRSEGMEIIRCSVGDRWVWQAMREHAAALGGEQSGHVICSHYGVTGDGLLTGSHLLAAAAAGSIPVSELSDLVRLPQVLVNVPIARKLPFDGLPAVSRELEGTERRLEGRGRVLLRYSGTESLARVMIEGEDAVEIETLADQLAEAIRLELS